jgi:hypothetical protein
VGHGTVKLGKGSRKGLGEVVFLRK